MTNFKKIALFVPVLLLLFACGKNTEQGISETKTPVVVQTQTVQAVAQNESFVLSGALEAREQASVGFLVAGKVQQVNADEGDYVQKGQLLAALDATDYNNALQIAEATLTRVNDDYLRASQLYLRNSLSQSDYVKASSGLKEAEANHSITKKQVADTRLYAPISGFISKKGVADGEIVSAGMPAFSIVSTDPIKARISVPESEISSVQHGMETQVEIPALHDAVVTGTVSLIGAVADPSTRTYAVEISLVNPQHVMKPGMVAEARLITAHVTQSISLPGQAIVRNSDGVPTVYVVDQNSQTALKRRVTLGNLNATGVEITAGLNAGEKVVIGGQHSLKDGDAVVEAGEAIILPVVTVTPHNSPADSIALAASAFSNPSSGDPSARWVLPALMLSLASVFIVFVLHYQHIQRALVAIGVFCYAMVAKIKVKDLSIQ